MDEHLCLKHPYRTKVNRVYGFVNTCTDVDYLHGSIEYWTITVQVLRTCARVATVVEVFNTRTEPV